MTKYLTFFLLVVAPSFVWSQKISPDNYKVNFSISNTAFNTVKGSLSGMTGTVYFNESDLENTKFDVCLQAVSIDTGNKKRDEHLRTEDFFFVSDYPTICFKSISIKKSGSSYVAMGKLTMHGVTKDITIPFTLEKEVLSGKFTINRQDYNVGGGSLLVGDEVDIEIQFSLGN